MGGKKYTSLLHVPLLWFPMSDRPEDVKARRLYDISEGQCRIFLTGFRQRGSPTMKHELARPIRAESSGWHAVAVEWPYLHQAKAQERPLRSEGVEQGHTSEE